MRKIYKSIGLIICIIIIFITCLCITTPKVEGEELLALISTSEETTEEISTTTEETTTTSVETTSTTQERISGIGETKGNVDIYYLNMLNKELNKLPKSVLNSFKRNGWHIYVTNENIAKTVFNGRYKSVQGVTIYKDQVILIEAREAAIKESTIHEFGHYVDYITGFETDEKKFEKIYDEEVETFKSRIINSSCVRDEQEFFAETLYYMYKNPSKCTPQALEFVKNKLNTL